MFLTLDRETGKMEEWKLPMGSANRGRNGYFLTGSIGGFVITWPQIGKPNCRVWYAPERKLYDFNVFTKEYKEVEIEFDYHDLIEHEPGFMEESEWMQYSLSENAFNSLKDFWMVILPEISMTAKNSLRLFQKLMRIQTELVVKMSMRL